MRVSMPREAGRPSAPHRLSLDRRTAAGARSRFDYRNESLNFSLEILRLYWNSLPFRGAAPICADSLQMHRTEDCILTKNHTVASDRLGSRSCTIKRRGTLLCKFCAVCIGKSYHSEDPFLTYRRVKYSLHTYRLEGSSLVIGDGAGADDVGRGDLLDGRAARFPRAQALDTGYCRR